MADVNKHITYSLTDIQRYLQGSMSAKEMHDLERAALEDPFLADALDGYSEADIAQAHTHLAHIDTAIRREHQKGKIVALPPVKKYRNWQVVAAVVLLIGVAVITYFMINQKNGDATLAKAESGSVVPRLDTVQTPAQTLLIPPTADSAAISSNKKPADNKGKRAVPRVEKKEEPPVQQPTANATVQVVDSASSINAEVVVTSAFSTRRSKEIAGNISDTNQQPIPNAKITLPDSTQAVTDKHGNFRIATRDSNVVADITALGYKPVKKQPLTNRDYNEILLKEKPFRPSDVEVINIGTDGKKTGDTTAVMPQGGWQSFQQYVYSKMNKQYDSAAVAGGYINGDLQLEFSISDAGEPVDFKVLHAPDAQTANDAINAIKTGPKWVSKNNNNKMRITVKYNR